jgi:hypothetical protein
VKEELKPAAPISAGIFVARQEPVPEKTFKTEELKIVAKPAQAVPDPALAATSRDVDGRMADFAGDIR